MKILFRRDYRRFQGGHLKLFDYYRHAVLLGHQADMYLTEESVKDENIRWQTLNIVEKWEPEKYDLLFLEGMDWEAIEKKEALLRHIPKINLIQHPRHSYPETRRYDFLKYRAIRICPSEYVKDKILSTNQVNGPVFTIKYGVYPDEINENAIKSIDILIVGINARKKAKQLYRILKIKNLFLNKRIKLINDWIPRDEFLSILESSRIAALFPELEEGFYLPALEAMGKRCIVICPNCGGNKDFCIHMLNCLMPGDSINEFLSAFKYINQMGDLNKHKLLENGIKTIREHSINNEKSKFSSILENISDLYMKGTNAI